ncbi:ATP-dependent zinc metalloprotease FtsH [Paraliomyxa miuraensis]|uniref:ATP-dependent zinc metalloprotease FtsH n=1 Tax=Paraliomyxa miuraensis TaxID=376150 RepID=UPI0022513B12|nr:ATP-dependent zinc metalloprotease FtsH [Paraliomyxa miuraensis]MCX4245659.1 ATP-dependent zinc metalloprotease FtsH [Paraliomyxa miuraensis]
MKQQTKTLLVWLGLIVAVLALANLFNSSQQTTQISYAQFIRQIHTLKDTTLNVEVHPGHVDIDYKLDDKTYEVTGPVTEELYTKLDANGIDYRVEPEEDSSILQFAIMWLPMILIVIIMVMFMRQMQAGGGKAMSFGKARARLLTEHQGKVTFKDVAGIDEAREEVEEIIDFLRDTRKYMRVGGRIPKGVLLMGPPGTGKTLLARAIAGEAGVSFFSISGSDFVEMFVGVGASRVRDLFEQGKKNAPCIIFIDEIDAVGRHRGAGLGGGHDEREQTLNQLLVEMDGFESNDGVILVAATNRPDVLDPALLRPGRFDRRIVVGLPDVRGREMILKVHVRKVPIEDDVDLSIIARGTPGFSGADLENLVNEAALMAARRGRDRVGLSDFERAKDKVLMGAERKSVIISEEEKRTTAWHEAGHTLVAMKLPERHVDPIHKVTIIPRGQALGVTQQLPEEDRHNLDRRYAEARIAILMGGRIAEELALDGQQTTGAGNDIEVATTLARKMVCEWGMSDKLGPIAYNKNDSEPFLGRDIARPKAYSESTAQAIDREVHEIVISQYNRARDILTTHSDALERLAVALIEREALGLEEVKAAIEGRPLPPLPEATPAKAAEPAAGEAKDKDAAKKDEAVRPGSFPVAEAT